MYLLPARASDTPDFATEIAFRFPNPAFSVWVKKKLNFHNSLQILRITRYLEYGYVRTGCKGRNLVELAVRKRERTGS
jgi:hypothetical protein